VYFINQSRFVLNVHLLLVVVWVEVLEMSAVEVEVVVFVWFYKRSCIPN
jgi:hypothetical protein